MQYLKINETQENSFNSEWYVRTAFREDLITIKSWLDSESSTSKLKTNNISDWEHVIRHFPYIDTFIIINRKNSKLIVGYSFGPFYLMDIKKEYRNQGFGKILVNEVINSYVSQKDVYAFFASLSVINSKPFWEKIGFEIIPYDHSFDLYAMKYFPKFKDPAITYKTLPILIEFYHDNLVKVAKTFSINGSYDSVNEYILENNVYYKFKNYLSIRGSKIKITVNNRLMYDDYLSDLVMYNTGIKFSRYEKHLYFYIPYVVDSSDDAFLESLHVNAAIFNQSFGVTNEILADFPDFSDN